MVAPLLAALVVAQSPVPFPHATATPICGAKTIPYQQSALASAGAGLWLACRDARRLVRLTASGATAKTVSLGAFRPWAVASGGGAVWVISRDVPQLLKLSPAGRQLARIALDAAPASLWFGFGSAWVGFESFGFERVDAKTGRTTTFSEGDGVSAFAGDGTSVYAVSHRDNAITRVSLAGGRSHRVVSGIVDVARGSTEAVAFMNGSLWLTGRGLDLLRVDPATGTVQTVTEIGPAGFAIAPSDGKLVVASYSRAGARRGDPVVGSFATVEPRAGKVIATLAATRPAYLSGLVVAGQTIYAADTVQGRFVRARM
ncbi:MAG: hypothetical protein ACTHKS_15525 [Gaiellaceae bacterium]